MAYQIRINPANAFVLESVSGALIHPNSTGKQPRRPGTDDWEFAVIAPSDGGTGQASGKRQHQPLVNAAGNQHGTIVMQKPIWQTSGFMAGRAFPSLTLEITDSGAPPASARILNARVVAVKTLAKPAPGSRNINELEEIEFTFQKIQWNGPAGSGKTFPDDWTQ